MSRLNNIKNTVGAVALAGLCVGLYWPRPTVSQAPPATSAPYCLEYPFRPVATGPVVAEKKKKPCEPVCKAPQVCVDGTCCLPAVQHSPGSDASFAWVEESLR